MDKEKLIGWTNKLGKAWSDRTPEVAANMFSKDVQYFESVFETPCVDWGAVFNLWKVVPQNQKDVTFGFTDIIVSGDFGVVNWQVTRTLIPSETKQIIDGIFLVKLNEDGLCNYFKQWRAVKEE